MSQTLKPDAVMQLDLEPLGRCNREPLKTSKSSRSQINFFKRDSNTGVSRGYCELFKNGFFIENLRWLLLTVLPQYSEVSWVVSYLISRIRVLSNLTKNLRKTLQK